MATPSPLCPYCSQPIERGAYVVPAQGEMAHQGCGDFFRFGNKWPEGTRQLVCLNCDRPFPSDSKAHRLCKACRPASERIVRPVARAQ